VAERSAAEQVKALVEAAEREARESREAVQRVAARADELSGRVDELAAGVAEAVAALKQEIEALRSASEAAEPAEAPAAEEEEEEEEEEASASEPSAVPEGARLLALKMALDGRPREETAAYLGENFELADPESLLDEVYARAEARK
jgi:outer membrane murein-binding lipoprotein Lpp